MEGNDIDQIVLDPGPMVKLLDGDRVTGSLQPLTSQATGAKNAELGLQTNTSPGGIHCHLRQEETLHFLHGVGQVWRDGQIHTVGPNNSVVIPPGVSHAVRPTGVRIEFFSIFSPLFDPNDKADLAERPVEWYGEHA